jgi:hypothetical protein
MFAMFSVMGGQEFLNQEFTSFKEMYEMACFLRSNGLRVITRAYRVVNGQSECYQPEEYGGSTCRIG